MPSIHLKLAVSSDDSFDVRHFWIRESLSTPFECHVTAVSTNDDVVLKDIVGRPGVLSMNTGYGNVSEVARLWSGIVSHVEQRQVESIGQSSYFFVVVPQLWVLKQRRLIRNFQHLSIPEIIQQVLGQWQIKPKLELGRTYKKLEYCVQYEETDYDFICRLMEQAGITYLFTGHRDQLTQLVLSDAPHLGEKRAVFSIGYVDNPNEAAQKEFVTKLRLCHEVKPGRLTLRDFDLRKKPDTPLFGEANPADAPEHFYEQYAYVPGASLLVPGEPVGLPTPVADKRGVARHDKAELNERAERALNAARRGKRLVEFETNCIDLRPGLIFRVAQHDQAELKDSDLLVRDLVLEGTAETDWTLQATAEFAGPDVPHLPQLRTPKPRVMGVQSAIVTGPPSEKEIHTDEFGRVTVQFHWDRDHEYDDTSSCWMRVSQGWAGSGYGTMMIPRIGQEVLVSYFEGDPDLPVVIGRTYNAKTPVPYPLPAFKTRSVWKSDSSPNSSGYNEIVFEDTSGGEWVYVQAQLDMQRLVKNNETERTGDNRQLFVGGNRHALVVNIDATMVGEKHQVQMCEPPSRQDMSILSQRKPEVTLLPIKLEMVEDTIFLTSGDAKTTIKKKEIIVEATGNIYIHSTGGNVIFEGGPNIKINC